MKTNISIKDYSWSLHETSGVEVKSMLYYVQSAGHFYCDPDYVTDRKDYDTHLLVLTIAGTGMLTYRNRSYDLQKDSCFLIDCKDHQNYRTNSDKGWEFIWIHFNGSNTADYYHKIYRQSGPVFYSKNTDVIKDEILVVHKLMKEKNQNLQFISAKHIVNILTELILISENQNSDNSYGSESIDMAAVFIENNYKKQISLDDISKAANLSKYYFSRLFKDHTGYSPYEFLKNYRISKSKSLLKQTAINVTDISRACGFDSPSHFIKIFKQSEGVTPKTFRNYWK